ncbi:MAG: dimethylmenaquinone methyltransferase [Planctomycetes bacterium]|jgi:demethylmenaquinone methyltransferase/2-methoxy-6-polyprenyl-1,4-benzoquinol methylase|nr:dimethylmenaquinone methyltransferase [Planctomycetota bacterium]
MRDARKVRSMFARIAGRYDLLNRFLSVGIDRRWRRRLIDRVGDLKGVRAVDACCGTGDLTLALEKRGARVVGVDFTPEMLAQARFKGARSRGGQLFVHGDALALPLRDGQADISTVAFGIRNVADRALGFAELARVVRPGGRVFVLEFSMPHGRILGTLYRFYFTRILPRIGGWISGSPEAYRYLPDTVLEWPTPAELALEMEAAGLERCGYQLLTGGIACISFGRVPEPS